MKKFDESEWEQIQSEIDKMKNGEKNVVIDSICSGIPILQINAILFGVKHGIDDPIFLKTLSELTDSDVNVFGVSMSECAKAACDVLNVIPYRGSEERVIRIIEGMKDGAII